MSLETQSQTGVYRKMSSSIDSMGHGLFNWALPHDQPLTSVDYSWFFQWFS